MSLPGFIEGLQITEEDWGQTPPALRQLVITQFQMIQELQKQIEGLKARLGQDSQNSNRPPSTDGIQQRAKRESKGAGKPGAVKGHKGHRQALLAPTEVIPILPNPCECGGDGFADEKPYYTHQHIELPEIVMEVKHFVLYEGKCASCGRICRGVIPEGFQVGYGPRLTALVGELSSSQRSSRSAVKEFLQSVLRVSISSGGIQRCVDRVSQAILPYYEAIAARARSFKVNYIDETPWYQHGVLGWLWVMANTSVAFFSVKASRSKAAFEELIGHWAGILVSDNYAVYRKWVAGHQTCLAHLRPVAIKRHPFLCIARIDLHEPFLQSWESSDYCFIGSHCLLRQFHPFLVDFFDKRDDGMFAFPFHIFRDSYGGFYIC